MPDTASFDTAMLDTAMLDTAMLDTAMLGTAVFDTVLGLPVHVLVVHAVVVLVPLMAVLSAVVAVAVSLVRRPGSAARMAGADRLVWPVAVVNIALVGLTLVARESGRTLQARFGGQTAVEHAALGERMPWFVLALAAASLAIAVLRRRDRARTDEAGGGWPLKSVAGVTVLAAIATAGWAVVVGHSGTEAVWQDRIEFSNTR